LRIASRFFINFSSNFCSSVVSAMGLTSPHQTYAVHSIHPEFHPILLH
jgi:hypothetical protein